MTIVVSPMIKGESQFLLFCYFFIFILEMVKQFLAIYWIILGIYILAFCWT
uniref:Uncharacterized protein n=1 Tax=Arundo donax TaxID=35708 RepID=A0A0A8XTD5_ARUDO